MEEADLKSLSPSTTNTEGLSEEEERILLEKEFDDYYEDRVQKTARISAAGYFYITRNTITRVFGMSLLFIFLLVKFDRLERSSMMAFTLPTMIPTTATPNSG